MKSLNNMKHIKKEVDKLLQEMYWELLKWETVTFQWYMNLNVKKPIYYSNEILSFRGKAIKYAQGRDDWSKEEKQYFRQSFWRKTTKRLYFKWIEYNNILSEILHQ